MDRRLVQILVVVANIQVRYLKTEVEKGSLVTAVGHGSVGPKESAKAVLRGHILSKNSVCARDPKGNWVNIPKPRHGDSHASGQSGNANELGDVGRNPGKSCLFFVRGRFPGISLTGDREDGTVKHRGSCGVRSVSVGP